MQQEKQLAQKLSEFPALAAGSLWPAQIEAVTNLEESFAAGRPRALIQMATGSGKTYTAINFTYRLVKYAGARRGPPALSTRKENPARSRTARPSR